MRKHRRDARLEAWTDMAASETESAAWPGRLPESGSTVSVFVATAIVVADMVGVRALAVHAKDDQAIAFYQHFGFAPSPSDPRHLFMIIKDIQLAAGQKP